jgi:hypothetical protein
MNQNGNGSGPIGHGPAHGRRDQRRRQFGRLDRRALLIRVPVVVVLGAAVAAGVAFDGAPDDSTGRQGADRIEASSMAPVAMPQSPPADRGASTWYCAAGTSADDGAVDHVVSVQNAGDDDADVRLTIYGGEMLDADAPTGPAAVEDMRVPAGRTTEVRLTDEVDTPLSAALVEVTRGDVAVGHQVEGPPGSGSGPCATVASPTWHLAWSSTARDARDLVVLFNPFPTGAVVDARFMTDEGPREPVRYQALPIPAESVVALDVGADVAGADHVAATFEVRSGRVVVDRVQAFDGSFGIEGLALGLGVPAPASRWVFADGEASSAGLGQPDPSTQARPRADEHGDTSDESADPRDDGDAAVTTERIVVYNPGEVRAEVDVTVVPAPGDGADELDRVELPPFSLGVGPGRFAVVDYGDHDRVVPGVPHATIVASTNGRPVVAQRVTIDEGPEEDGSRPGEITAAPGAPASATTWRLPLGAALGGDGGRTEVVVFNPDAGDAVDLRIDPASAAAEGAAGTVAPGERLAVPLPDGAPRQGIEVVADGPVVVEYVVRADDGRRIAAGPAIPSADGIATL